MEKPKSQVAMLAKAETTLDSSHNLNKRKLNDTTTSDVDQNSSKTASSNQQADSNASPDPNKKLKPFIGLKPTKIQLKLSSSLSSSASAAASTKTQETIKSESVRAVPPKLPTGNLAPSNSIHKQPSLVKNDKIAKVFGSDDDDDNDTEEMPLEAKMKMKNVGRNTPTSTGPNSYGKTALGFCDSRALFEKQLKEKAERLLREEEQHKASSK